MKENHGFWNMFITVEYAVNKLVCLTIFWILISKDQKLTNYSYWMPSIISKSHAKYTTCN